MKHAIPIALLTVAVIVAVPMALKAHHDYAHKIAVQHAQAAATQAKTVASERATIQDLQTQATVLQTELNKSHTNCLLGASAYTNLTAYSKARMKQPDCSL
jgi:hypothetical protein